MQSNKQREYVEAIFGIEVTVLALEACKTIANYRAVVSYFGGDRVQESWRWVPEGTQKYLCTITTNSLERQFNSLENPATDNFALDAHFFKYACATTGELKELRNVRTEWQLEEIYKHLTLHDKVRLNNLPDKAN